MTYETRPPASTALVPTGLTSADAAARLNADDPGLVTPPRRRLAGAVWVGRRLK